MPCFYRLFATFLCALADPPKSAVPKGYKLVWKDEFAGAVNSPPDSKFWGYDLGNNGWGNQELQNYVNDVEHAHVVSDTNATDGKAMQILATSDGKGNYTSARLLTKGKTEFQYGYIEARIRLPYGQGIWPAFWMLGANFLQPGMGWPRCGEIDIMENIGKQEWWGKIRSSLHGPGHFGANSLHDDFDLPTGKAFKDDYHTFSLLWEKDRIQFFVDGKLFQTRTPADVPGTEKEWAFNHSFFLIANVAVGGNWPGNPDASTVFPQRMLIDYVRVYQKK
jgi:beta-glucanase (GH16 family)